MTSSRLSPCPPRERHASATLRSDERGGAVLQTIALAVVLALGAGTAMKVLAHSVRTKADCTGIGMVTLALGAGPCRESSAGEPSVAAGPGGGTSVAAGPGGDSGPSPAPAARPGSTAP